MQVKWLLNKDMLAVFQSFLSKFKVGVDRCNDGDCIDVRGLQHFVGVPGDVHVRIGLTHAPQGVRALVTNPHDTRMLLGMEIPDNVRAPIAVPDNSHADDILFHSALNFDVGGALRLKLVVIFPPYPSD